MDTERLISRIRAEFSPKIILLEEADNPVVEVFTDGKLSMSGTWLQTMGAMADIEHVTCNVHADGTALCWEWDPIDGALVLDTEQEFD